MTHFLPSKAPSQRTSYRGSQVFIMQVQILKPVTNFISDGFVRTAMMTGRPCPVVLSIAVAAMARGRGAAMASWWGVVGG